MERQNGHGRVATLKEDVITVMNSGERTAVGSDDSVINNELTSVNRGNLTMVSSGEKVMVVDIGDDISDDQILVMDNGDKVNTEEEAITSEVVNTNAVGVEGVGDGQLITQQGLTGNPLSMKRAQNNWSAEPVVPTIGLKYTQLERGVGFDHKGSMGPSQPPGNHHEEGRQTDAMYEDRHNQQIVTQSPEMRNLAASVLSELLKERIERTSCVRTSHTSKRSNLNGSSALNSPTLHHKSFSSSKVRVRQIIVNNTSPIPVSEKLNEITTSTNPSSSATSISKMCACDQDATELDNERDLVDLTSSILSEGRSTVRDRVPRGQTRRLASMFETLMEAATSETSLQRNIAHRARRIKSVPPPKTARRDYDFSDVRQEAVGERSADDIFLGEPTLDVNKHHRANRMLSRGESWPNNGDGQHISIRCEHQLPEVQQTRDGTKPGNVRLITSRFESASTGGCGVISSDSANISMSATTAERHRSTSEKDFCFRMNLSPRHVPAFEATDCVYDGRTTHARMAMLHGIYERKRLSNGHHERNSVYKSIDRPKAPSSRTSSASEFAAPRWGVTIYDMHMARNVVEVNDVLSSTKRIGLYHEPGFQHRPSVVGDESSDHSFANYNSPRAVNTDRCRVNFDNDYSGMANNEEMEERDFAPDYREMHLNVYELNFEPRRTSYSIASDKSCCCKEGNRLRQNKGDPTRNTALGSSLAPTRLNYNVSSPNAPLPSDNTWITSDSTVERFTNDNSCILQIKEISEELAIHKEHLSKSLAAVAEYRKKSSSSVTLAEVCAQRQFLLCYEREEALRIELDRLKALQLSKMKLPQLSKLQSSFEVHSMIVDLSPSFYVNNAGRDGSFAFVVVLKSGRQVDATQAVTVMCDRSTQPISASFKDHIRFTGLPIDFNIAIDVYAMKVSERKYEDNYHLCEMFTNSAKLVMPPHQMENPLVSSLEFTCCGSLILNRDAVGTRRFYLESTLYPLEGTIELNSYCTPLPPVMETILRGYLSMSDDIGRSWTRYWTVLHHGMVQFWKCPNDEASDKHAVVSIDLAKCAHSKVMVMGNEVGSCPPNMFVVEVPIGTVPTIQMKRVMLSAETKEMCAGWIGAINETLAVLHC